MIAAIFPGSWIWKTSFPVFPSPAGVSKPKPKAFLKSRGSSAANSVLSVMILIASLRKLLQKSKIPKHSASAQQPGWGIFLQISALAAADVKALLSQVSESVYENSGIRLEPEIRIW